MPADPSATAGFLKASGRLSQRAARAWLEPKLKSGYISRKRKPQAYRKNPQIVLEGDHVQAWEMQPAVEQGYRDCTRG